MCSACVNNSKLRKKHNGPQPPNSHSDAPKSQHPDPRTVDASGKPIQRPARPSPPDEPEVA